MKRTTLATTAIAALAVAGCGSSSVTSTSAATGQDRLWFTNCTYTNTVPMVSNGLNGGPGTWTVTATNETSDPITLRTLNVQFSSFSDMDRTLASQAVHPGVTLAGDTSRTLKFTAPGALYTLQTSDPQAYGNVDGSDVECSQNGWS